MTRAAALDLYCVVYTCYTCYLTLYTVYCAGLVVHVLVWYRLSLIVRAVPCIICCVCCAGLVLPVLVWPGDTCAGGVPSDTLYLLSLHYILCVLCRLSATRAGAAWWYPCRCCTFCHICTLFFLNLMLCVLCRRDGTRAGGVLYAAYAYCTC